MNSPQSNPADPSPSLEISGINWKTSIFLIATLVVSLVATPFYIARLGLSWFEVGIFLFMFAATGMSITAGYHRLFAHRAYSAKWPVRLVTALFGAASFEMSALEWSAEHRYHHKYTDQDGDPHDPHSIQRGFFWAHVGWLLVHVNPTLQHTNVADLRRDPIVRWQHRWYVPVAITMGFLLPMAVGVLWAALSSVSLWHGLAAGFLFGGCLRIVVVQHLTFLINSWAHTFGRRPYDRSTSARDSGILAYFTFGEGYHNYHHAFQSDYRNGIKPWHFDPGKWLIWSLSKVGLASDLRRVPMETIRLAQVRQGSSSLMERMTERGHELNEHLEASLLHLEEKLEEAHLRFRQLLVERAKIAEKRGAARRRKLAELKLEIREARREFRSHLKAWRQARKLALALA